MIKFQMNITKSIYGILLFFISAIINYILLGKDPITSDYILILPGVTFGLAIVVSNIRSLNSLKSKIISIIFFPLIMTCVWLFNIIIMRPAGGGVSELFGINAGILFIGMYSSLTAFLAFNFFFQRKVIYYYYIMVIISGGLSFLINEYLFVNEGDGLIHHLDKLIFIWQIIVGSTIAMTFRDVELELFYE